MPRLHREIIALDGEQLILDNLPLQELQELSNKFIDERFGSEVARKMKSLIDATLALLSDDPEILYVFYLRLAFNLYQDLNTPRAARPEDDPHVAFSTVTRIAHGLFHSSEKSLYDPWDLSSDEDQTQIAYIKERINGATNLDEILDTTGKLISVALYNSLKLNKIDDLKTFADMTVSDFQNYPWRNIGVVRLHELLILLKAANIWFAEEA
jgi:hypothetical protein